MPRSFAAFFALCLLLAGCVAQTERVAPALAAIDQSAPQTEAVWAFEESDIPPDPAFRFGRFANGMRYIIRPNATPEGTGIVRLEIKAGSLDEHEGELGFAHFVEHMAFNGSTNVPEGEMVRLLERNGLAFGADTNASTSFNHTTYKLDLPRNDPELLSLSLMLMRETASELTFSLGAVDRERGVVLAELRDRNSYRFQEVLEDTEFLHPAALYPKRFPIGTVDDLEHSNAETLRAFWAREYVPQHTTLLVIGDFDPDLVEAEIRYRFGDWAAKEAESQPGGGPIAYNDAGRTDIYTDPALPERVTVTRHGRWLDEPDTVAQRQEGLLRRIGYAIVNRRLKRLARQASPPFHDAGFGTGDVFEVGRSTRLIVDSADRKWKRALTQAALEYRRALEFGFTQAEVDEQVANIRTSAENAAASAATRNHRELESLAWNLVRDDRVPSHPATVLERLNAFAREITPVRVLEALKREAVPLNNPLIRFRGRFAPEGGEAALRQAWDAAMAVPIDPPEAKTQMAFAYTDFGKPGTVSQDTRGSDLGIRKIKFANGVMLNIKRTELEEDKIRLRVSIDGGKMLNTMQNPLATEMSSFLPSGGLAQHSRDEIQTITAGRTVSARLDDREATFTSSVSTTPRDLELQLQLLAAYVTDPGYREEGQTEFRHLVNSYFKQLRATPAAAYRAEIDSIISDEDPRFSIHEPEEYRRLTFDKLSTDLADRLQHGAIEIGIVGDIDEESAIELVARTFGALPDREADFRDYGDQPARTFTDDRNPRTVMHDGKVDQALLAMVWPTRDDGDPEESLALQLLERVVRIQLTDSLREALGKAYSPGASSSLSRNWSGYGTFTIRAPVGVSEVSAARQAIIDSIMTLREGRLAPDILQRAREPLLETYANSLKSNGFWLSLTARAQTEPDRLDRFLSGPDWLSAMAVSDLQQLALRYLDPSRRLEILVLPSSETANSPASAGD